MTLSPLYVATRFTASDLIDVTRPPVHPPIHPSIYPSIRLFVRPFVRPFIYPAMYSLIHLLIYLFLYIFILFYMKAKVRVSRPEWGVLTPRSPTTAMTVIVSSSASQPQWMLLIDINWRWQIAYRNFKFQNSWRSNSPDNGQLRQSFQSTSTSLQIFTFSFCMHENM